MKNKKTTSKNAKCRNYKAVILFETLHVIEWVNTLSERRICGTGNGI